MKFFNGVYYILEQNTKTDETLEYMLPCDEVSECRNVIHIENIEGIDFPNHFLTCYYKLASKFNKIRIDIDKDLNDVFKAGRSLLPFYNHIVSEAYIKDTKKYFDYIEMFVNYICDFKNKKEFIRSLDWLSYHTKINIPTSVYHFSTKGIFDDINNAPLQFDSGFERFKSDVLKYDAAKNPKEYIWEIDDVYDDDINFSIKSNLPSYNILVYKIDNAMELFLLSLELLYESKHIMKSCEFCKLPFIPMKRTDEKYCHYFDNDCKIEARKQKECDRYKQKNISLYKIIYQKFTYRQEQCEDEKKRYQGVDWLKLRGDFVDIYQNNKKMNKDILIEWLDSVNDMLDKHAKEGKPFVLPELDIIDDV